MSQIIWCRIIMDINEYTDNFGIAVRLACVVEFVWAVTDIFEYDGSVLSGYLYDRN